MPQGRKARPIEDVTSKALISKELDASLRLFTMNSLKE
jgi:hypothetical protein